MQLGAIFHADKLNVAYIKISPTKRKQFFFGHAAIVFRYYLCIAYVDKFQLRGPRIQEGKLCRLGYGARRKGASVEY